MDICKCNSCGKLFNNNNQDEEVCPSCQNNQRRTYISLQRCLSKNPDITLQELHNKTGIEKRTILKMIKERRIHVKNSVECGRCGKLIDTGKFCYHCRQELITGVSSGTSDKINKA
mgnify:CR=1 FL=1